MRDEPLPHNGSLTRQYREDTLREAGVEGQFGQAQGGQRGQLGGLEHDGVAGRERGREPPPGDRHREVPRHDDADDAERFVERHVDAARHRDLPAGQPFRCARVVVEDVADVARLPAGVADRVPRVADLKGGERLDMTVHSGREATQ